MAARLPRLTQSLPIAWWLMALGPAVGSLFVATLPHQWQWSLQWHRSEAALSVHAWWTAALVHYGSWHLGANLVAAIVVGAWGHVARLDARSAGAWCAAWPLTHVLLATDPSALAHYAGLSALLHAGVAIACAEVLRTEPPHRRWVGAAVGVLLMIKVTWESPWTQAAIQGVDVHQWLGPALAGAPGSVQAGHAHGCGVVAGLFAWAMARVASWTQP